MQKRVEALDDADVRFKTFIEPWDVICVVSLLRKTSWLGATRFAATRLAASLFAEALFD